jgi:hypothetical protein
MGEREDPPLCFATVLGFDLARKEPERGTLKRRLIRAGRQTRTQIWPPHKTFAASPAARRKFARVRQPISNYKILKRRSSTGLLYASREVRHKPNVQPPAVDRFGYGPRVPALVISPYARAGLCCHTSFDFTSPLKLIEERFNLKPLASRDRDANDMLDCFNFEQQPLAPYIITPHR